MANAPLTYRPDRVAPDRHGSPGARAAVRDTAAPDPLAAEQATRPSWGGRRTRTAALASVSMCVPEKVVSNATVAEGAGVTEQWIVHRTGVRERRHVSEGERLQDIAVSAGRKALDEAGVTPEQVDLVLVATLAADEITPNAAPLVAHELGAARRRRDGRGRRLHRLPVGALAGRSAGRGRPRGERAGDRRRRAQPLHRHERSRHGGPVRRRRRRQPGHRRQRRRRADRPHRAARGRPRRAGDLRHAHRAGHPHAGPRHLQGRRAPALPVDARGRGARRIWSSTTSGCSSSTRPTRASSPPSARSSASRASA